MEGTPMTNKAVVRVFDYSCSLNHIIVDQPWSTIVYEDDSDSKENANPLVDFWESQQSSDPYSSAQVSNRTQGCSMPCRGSKTIQLFSTWTSQSVPPQHLDLFPLEGFRHAGHNPWGGSYSCYSTLGHQEFAGFIKCRYKRTLFQAILGVGKLPLHKPYPYSLYRWGFLHFRYLKNCVIRVFQTHRIYVWYVYWHLV